MTKFIFFQDGILTANVPDAQTLPKMSLMSVLQGTDLFL